VWKPCPEMLEAKDGRKQAHMDVLVAVSGQGFHTGAYPKFAVLPSEKRKPRTKAGFPHSSGK